jgi:hypothetical protein
MSHIGPTADFEPLEHVVGGDDDYGGSYDNSSSYSEQTYSESSSSGDGYEQLAGLSGERSSSAPAPTLLGESTQRFDDGTSLTTYNWDTGTVVRSNEQQIQMFDDGSRFITDNYTTRTVGSSAPPETTSRTWSVDSLDARLNSSDLGYYLDHPGTATQTDIFTAQDVLRNYDDRLPGYARDGLNDYINGYYTGTPPPVFGGEPPTPRPSPGLYPVTGFG